ncbi:MAG: zinc ribbon domain-containing protein [Candidatus Bathyarchaeota archaeon]|jgi:magnesium-transporting ATPase (P-type)|nr:zinc ribbon domain-containing protein [Candidatus Bathyarchaeota archaeon A05DMB-5]MDH7558434.1 zinc ribbon domain-containing protein [Candidatus Bathyarchaeota archaeon]
MSEKKVVERKYYCQSCGRQIKPTDTLCPICGKNLNKVGKRIEVTVRDTIGLSENVSYQLKAINRKELARNFLVSFAISLFVVIAIFLILFFVIRLFPDYVTISSANDLLNNVINVDGIPLGFVGIVFAQLFLSIMNQQNVLYKQILEKPDEADENMKSFEFMDVRKHALSFITVSIFVFLLGSIFISMANIAQNSKFLPTDTYATFGLLFGPLLCTIIAVILLTLALTVLPMRPPFKRIKNN